MGNKTLGSRKKLTIIGSPLLPRTFVDTAHLSILNAPVTSDGEIKSITLRLGGEPPGEGVWECRVYERTASRAFRLLKKARFIINTSSFMEQTSLLSSPLHMSRGQYVGIFNPAGRLSLTYTRGTFTESGGMSSDLWYVERPPPADIHSELTGMLIWNGRVGWYATMEQDHPPPLVKVHPCTLAADMKTLLEGDGGTDTFDITFLIGPNGVPVKAHRGILASRCRYFRAMLSGGFVEGERREIALDDADVDPFRLLLEWIYTGRLPESLSAQEIADLLELSSRYCVDALVTLCESRLKDCVNVETVCSLHAMACDTGAEQLQRYCSFYAAKMHGQLIDTVCDENREAMQALAIACGLRDLRDKCECRGQGARRKLSVPPPRVRAPSA